eukprot:1140105-Pelagomonas_calceolata.AAC.2
MDIHRGSALNRGRSLGWTPLVPNNHLCAYPEQDKHIYVSQVLRSDEKLERGGAPVAQILF